MQLCTRSMGAGHASAALCLLLGGCCIFPGDPKWLTMLIAAASIQVGLAVSVFKY